MFISQIGVVPFLSGYLMWRDTTILMFAVLFAIIGHLIVAFNTKVWVLYIAYIFWMLFNTITTTSRSNLSKLMMSTEVGKAFSVLGILQALLPLASKPVFMFIYKTTLDTFPGAYRVLTASLYCIVLGLIIFTHFGLKRMNKDQLEQEPEEMKGLKDPTND